ncbi:hypothetical protein [Synoicihabitans lomoniglobus]|uniref:Uncharacterized protein n=1 Tax=Synoicihabitans lomoniglobus TaxID=2909285 RepID=A0AAF0CMP7_9BACT|nr:hypothetical protein [Opitutaceae bacterium LMO-M01]WED63606.1 hypothetical protein PXH66_14815 [Opitutaceae bacterium LMO-M01]
MSVFSGDLWAQVLRKGMIPMEVREVLGPPQSSMAMGESEIWLYPEGGRVVFMSGKAAKVDKFTFGAAEAVAEAPSAVVATETDVPPDALASAAETAAPDELADTVAATDEPADFSALVEQMEAEDAYEYQEPAVGQRVMALLLQTVIAMVVMIVILKLAFKWSDIHGDWGQMILPAAVSAGTRAVVLAVAEFGFNTTAVFHVDHALSYFALVIALMKTTHASSLPRAVAVAGAAKLASIVVWVIISVALLQTMFG